MDETVFTQSNCSEWGGILVEFVHGDSAKSLSLIKEQRIIKITAPNKKGSFEWSKIKSFKFKKTSDDQGVLNILFNEEFPGTDKGLIVMGLISKSCWGRLKDNSLGEIVFLEE